MNLSVSIRYILLIPVLFLPGCYKTYNQRLLPVKNNIADGNYQKALSSLKKAGLSKQSKNRLLYNLEAGLLYHLAGEYGQSNRFLENAEWISDELYTKSITNEAASLVTSDMIVPYRGEYYEYLFTNYYKLLNYLYLGNLEDALVEVRRINHKLSIFNRDDAFMHYITAILYEYNFQDDDAFIEYKKAYESYSSTYNRKYGVEYPRQLSRDIALFCRQSRFPRCSEFPLDKMEKPVVPREYGSAIFIMETGFIPFKTEVRTEAAIPQEYRKKYKNRLADTYYLTVALPSYAPLEDFTQSAAININGSVYGMDMVEDLGIIARTVLKDEEPKILAKAIARAVTKYLAYNAVKGKKEDGKDNTIRKVLGTTVNVFGAATETADTRSWLTLPNRIFFARLYLAPGDYTFRVNSKTAKGLQRQVHEQKFSIKKGETRLFLIRN